MKGFVIGLVLMLTVAGCGGIGKIQTQVDKSDRSAFAALQGFQRVEEASWHAKALWPTAAQHQAINAKLSAAFGLVATVASGTLALQPGESLPQIINDELTQLSQAITDISALVTTQAPPAAQTTLTTAKARVATFAATIRGAK